MEELAMYVGYGTHPINKPKPTQAAALEYDNIRPHDNTEPKALPVVIGLDWIRLSPKTVWDLDCPKSGPGPVQSLFAGRSGPGPGPRGLGRHVPDLDLGQRVRVRYSPSPDLALMENLYIVQKYIKKMDVNF